MSINLAKKNSNLNNMDLFFYIFATPYDGRKSAINSQVTLQGHSQSAMLGEGQGF